MEQVNSGRSQWLILRNSEAEQQDLPSELIEQLLHDQRSLIGMSYYYIRIGKECPILCRMPAGADTLKKEEVLEHTLHGISDDDLMEAVRSMLEPDRQSPTGYYQLSPRIEHKLRVLLEIE